MNGGRLIITTIALLAVGILGLIPAAADAGSLLSGYGGPGQGNQAILGSALLNGPSGKGGSGGGGSSGGGLVAGGSQTAGVGGGGAAGATRSAQASKGAAGRRSGSARSGRHLNGSTRQASAGGSQPYIGTYGPAASHASAGGSQPLGLSGAEEAYILLALVVLLLTGLLTRRLARANHGDEAGTQAIRRRTRLTN